MHTNFETDASFAHKLNALHTFNLSWILVHTCKYKFVYTLYLAAERFPRHLRLGIIWCTLVSPSCEICTQLLPLLWPVTCKIPHFFKHAFSALLWVWAQPAICIVWLLDMSLLVLWTIPCCLDISVDHHSLRIGSCTSTSCHRTLTWMLLWNTFCVTLPSYNKVDTCEGFNI